MYRLRDLAHGTVPSALLALVQLAGCGGGEDGLHCWDLDGDGEFDESEDLDADGQATALDCRGAPGSPGEAGTPGDDGEDGAPGDDGEDGASGTDGVDGEDGLSCWDLDGDGFFDPDEDLDGDGSATVGDCAAVSSIDKRHLRMTAASAWCMVHVDTVGSARIYEFPSTGAPISGNEVCANYSPSPDNTCYGAVIIHDNAIYASPMYWEYNGPRDCSEPINIFAGQEAFACCDD